METPKEPTYSPPETSLIRPDSSSFHFESGTIDLAHRNNVPNLNAGRAVVGDESTEDVEEVNLLT